jgi:importin subunit alpha-6/7
MQLLEAAWCLTNIAAGEPEETKSLLPALPLLIAHLGGQFSLYSWLNVNNVYFFHSQ